MVAAERIGRASVHIDGGTDARIVARMLEHHDRLTESLALEPKLLRRAGRHVRADERNVQKAERGGRDQWWTLILTGPDRLKCDVELLTDGEPQRCVH